MCDVGLYVIMTLCFYIGGGGKGGWGGGVDGAPKQYHQDLSGPPAFKE